VIDRWLERLALLGGVLLVAVGGLISYEVVARYLFNAPTTWILDVSIYLTMWATFLAVGHTLRAGAHIRMDLYVRRLAPRVRRRTDVIVALVALAFSALLTWQGLQSIADAVRLGEVTLSTIRVPLWVPLAAIPTGGLILVAGWLLCLRDRRIP
jgi:TRAP-type C4-dicarboxylate transport system permease small subunit